MYYKYEYNAACNFPRYDNNIILDVKSGDVNGDGIPDIIYLTGERTQYSFFRNISLLVQDGSTKLWFSVPLLPDYNTGYNPWLFLGDFTNDRVNDILINLPVGGSGDLTYYYVVSLLKNQPVFILIPEQFADLNRQMGFDVIYRNYYKVDIVSRKLNKTFILDVSDRKEDYEGIVYDKQGKLIKPLKGFIIDMPHLYPIQFNGGEAYRLMSQQDIAGTSHADRLGYLVSYRAYSNRNATWELNTNQIGVLI